MGKDKQLYTERGKRRFGFFKEKLDRIVAFATRKGDKVQDEKNPAVIRAKKNVRKKK